MNLGASTGPRITQDASHSQPSRVETSSFFALVSMFLFDRVLDKDNGLKDAELVWLLGLLAQKAGAAEEDDTVFQEAGDRVRYSEFLRSFHPEPFANVGSCDGGEDPERGAGDRVALPSNEQGGAYEGAGEDAAEEARGRGAGRCEGCFVRDHLPDHQQLQRGRNFWSS